jgi:HSP20 family molecular chaperone IbpA
MSNIAVQDSNGVMAKSYQRRVVSPPVDVFESPDDLLIIADVPGVPNGSIDLRVESGTLTLLAKHAAPSEEHPALAREYDEADFSATFRIPSGIDTSAIIAEAKNGTLVVRLPKAAAAKPRKIAVA